MIDDLIEGVFERDESSIQALCYQWSKREDGLTAKGEEKIDEVVEERKFCNVAGNVEAAFVEGAVERLINATPSL